MNLRSFLLRSTFILSMNTLAHAAPDRAQLLVWAQEAITATYTYNFKEYEQEQKAIAQYFTADGWIAYSKALNASKLPESIQKNAYNVSAVATQPPALITLGPTHWAVSMPILVVYKNPQYQQQQNLKVVIQFSQAPKGQGVRGFSASSLKATSISPPCQCSAQEEGPKSPVQESVGR